MLRNLFTHALPLAVLASLLLAGLAPVAAAGHQDDAGSGADAPNDWSAALLVTSPTFQGSILPEESDVEDWYRVLVPAGKGVRVTMTPAGADFDLVALSDTGAMLDRSFFGGNTQEVVQTGTPTEGVRIGVVHWSGRGAYSVQVEFVDLPDVRVASIEIHRDPVTTDMGPVPDAVGPVDMGTQRRITVTLSNEGIVAAESSTLYGWVEQMGSNRWLEPVPFRLDAGETTTLTLEWDATGQVGDARIVVVASVPADAWQADNVASASGYATVGNVGVGVDVLNRWVSTPLLPFAWGAAGTFYDEGGLGAYAVAAGPLTFAFVEAGVGRGYGPYAIACAAVVIGTCVLA